MAPRTDVLYFHGFASSPMSAKVVALRGLLEPYGITLAIPDLNLPSFRNLSFAAMVSAMSALAVALQPRVLVGSSLGALLALEVARGLNVPLVLIAPALGVADRWMTLIPDGDPILVSHYRSGIKEPIHRRFFEEMAEVRSDAAPPPGAVTVIMGSSDESVPVERVSRIWQSWLSSGRLAEGSRLVLIEEGDHGLVDHVATIAHEIRLALRRSEAADLLATDV